MSGVEQDEDQIRRAGARGKRAENCVAAAPDAAVHTMMSAQCDTDTFM
jgi:hypothetical protein